MAKAFSSDFLPVDVVLYPLYFSWFVSFCAVLWNGSYRLCKNEYPKIKFKAADVVSFGVESDQACSSHTSVGKVVSNLLRSGFGTDRILGCFTLMVTLSSYHRFVPLFFSSPHTLPHFPGCFPLLVEPHRCRESQIVL